MAYTVPGAIVEEQPPSSFSIPSGATAVTAFIGVFRDRNGKILPTGQCKRITGWLEFTQFYGPSEAVDVTLTLGQLTEGELKGELKDELKDELGYRAVVTHTDYLGSLSVRHFFDNGGGVCYIVPYHHGADKLDKLVPLIADNPEISLLVWCEHLHNEQHEQLDKLVYTALGGLLTGDYAQAGYFLLMDTGDEEGSDLPEVNRERSAAYYPALKTLYQYTFSDETKIHVQAERSVLDALGLEENDALLSTMNEEVRVAIDEPLPGEDNENPLTVIKKALAAQKPQPVYLRASPAVAGAYNRTDQAVGPWKACANVPLFGVETLWDGLNKKPVIVTDELQTTMYAHNVNAIRSFRNRGPLIWGARTRVGQVLTDWTFIPVRRLFDAAERDIQGALRFAVFEPNNALTWERVRAAIDAYLRRLWRQGALLGEKPEAAYFVQIGKDITMDENDIRMGKMIVKVGLAAVRPAEFIVLSFSQFVKL